MDNDKSIMAQNNGAIEVDDKNITNCDNTLVVDNKGITARSNNAITVANNKNMPRNSGVFVDKDRVYFESLFSYLNLFRAHLVSRRCKRHKDTVVAFEFDLSANLYLLHKEILDGRYSIRQYRTFYVYEPKKRLIQSCQYRHRVAQHCLCDNYLTPLLDSKLIYDNCACRKDKGVDFCIKRTVKFLREHYMQHGNSGYCLRVDVSKYFASIDREILLTKLGKVVHNRYIMAMISNILRDYPDSGLPIGNQTSQIMAIFYLNDLDRLLKDKLGVKHYIRYMDDLFILHKDRKYLENLLKIIEESLTKDKLRINPKTSIVPVNCGVDFIGRNFRFTDNGGVLIRMRASNKRRLKRKLTILHRFVNNGTIDIDRARNILASYWGLLKRGKMRASYYGYFMLPTKGSRIVPTKVQGALPNKKTTDNVNI